jgi:hypothetical protein
MYSKYIGFLIILFINLKIMQFEKTFVESEKELTKKLLKGYDKTLRPDDTVKLKFSMHLNRIITIIEKEQILVVNVFVDHEWVDNRLKWNPSEHNNISLLRVISDLIWVPDTFIDTVADHSGFIMPIKGTYFILTNDGIFLLINLLFFSFI